MAFNLSTVWHAFSGSRLLNTGLRCKLLNGEGRPRLVKTKSQKLKVFLSASPWCGPFGIWALVSINLSVAAVSLL